jgi:hypothetical protein
VASRRSAVAMLRSRRVQDPDGTVVQAGHGWRRRVLTWWASSASVASGIWWSASMSSARGHVSPVGGSGRGGGEAGDRVHPD